MSNDMTPNIAILYEDQDILAINKPAGLMVHGDGRAKGPFVADWVLNKFPETKGVGEPARSQDGKDIERPGIVHRLDRETSGVMLLAKTQKGFESLKKQFQDRTIKKKYIAFVWGEMEDDFGTIDRPIGRSASDFRRWSAQRGARGELREAETYWVKKGSFRGGAADGTAHTFTLIEAEPKTGRTHQIRVHFAAIQHPIVGDSLYASKREPALGFERTALHARMLGFETLEGKKIEVQAPLPEDFAKVVKEQALKA